MGIPEQSFTFSDAEGLWDMLIGAKQADMFVQNVVKVSDDSFLVIARSGAQAEPALPQPTPQHVANDLPVELPPGSSKAECRYCHNVIYWSESNKSQSGKKIPLDPNGQNHDCPSRNQ